MQTSNTTEQLVRSVQAHWQPLARLRLIRCSQPPPGWVLAAAEAEVQQLSPVARQACRGRLARLQRIYRNMYVRWLGALVLASLLAAVMVLSACATPLQVRGAAVLAALVTMVVLPPLVICHRIACDYIAANALCMLLSARPA